MSRKLYNNKLFHLNYFPYFCRSWNCNFFSFAWLLVSHPCSCQKTHKKKATLSVPIQVSMEAIHKLFFSKFQISISCRNTNEETTHLHNLLQPKQLSSTLSLLCIHLPNPQMKWPVPMWEMWVFTFKNYPPVW